MASSPTRSVGIILFIVLSALACQRIGALSTPTHLRPKTTEEAGRPPSFGSLIQQNQSPEYNALPRPTAQKWYCTACAVGFDKLKNYKQHLEGKKHKAVIAAADGLWKEYQNSGPAFYDPSVLPEIVTSVWSLDDFMTGLQARSRSSIKRVLSASTNQHNNNGSGGGGGVDPNIRLEDLSPNKRAMLWRLLQTTSEAHDTLDMPAMISALPPKYVRVKELLESLLVFGHFEQLLRKSKKRVSNVHDVGCGHGMVGMLCAAAYPHITVQSIDRVPRESFQAQRRAFVESRSDMDNLHFVRGDLSVLEKNADDFSSSSSGGHSLLLCVHGCKSLTHESIELAEANAWAWLSLPCCLQAEHHLDPRTNLKVDDDMRFTMLCGAIAAKYNAGTVSSIDRRITGRGIVLTSLGRSAER